MTDFRVLHWDPTNAAAAAAAVGLRRALSGGWQFVMDLDGFVAALPLGADCDRLCHRIGDDRGLAIGQMFDRAATERGAVFRAAVRDWCKPDALATARAVVDRAWGAYVVVLRDRGDIAVIRDPLGALDCLTWHCDGVRVLGGDPTSRPAATAAVTIDWDRVAALVATPTEASEALALTGIASIAYGSLTRFAGGTVTTVPLWRPADFCPPRVAAAAADAPRLAAMVDACVAAWASAFDTGVAELSGGLDSAIVAAALQRCRPAPVDHWVNYHALDPQADERDFARAIARRLGLVLIEVARGSRALGSADLAALATAARPGISGMDVHYDHDLGARAAARRCQAIFTGQGGDAVFFQMPTRLVAADLRRDRTGSRAQALVDIARWTRSTVWATAGAALFARHQPPGSAPPPGVLSLGGRAPVAAHLWLDDSSDLSPAKRLQVWGLANSRVYFGPSARARQAEVVHPLLSQPLVEHVLGIPVIGLTGGRGDRRLARQAFAGRLPPAVLSRHGKGDLTAFYGRLVARSAPFLRDHLGGGVLAEQGLIDRRGVAALLAPEALAVADCYTEILTTAVIESWARHWSRAG